MEDLEILCRDCHKAHHKLDKIASKTKRGERGIHVRAIYPSLSRRQKDETKKEFGIFSDAELYAKIAAREFLVIDHATKLLGCSYFHGNPRQNKSRKPFSMYGLAKCCRNKSGLIKKL